MKQDKNMLKVFKAINYRIKTLGQAYNIVKKHNKGIQGVKQTLQSWEDRIDELETLKDYLKQETKHAKQN